MTNDPAYLGALIAYCLRRERARPWLKRVRLRALAVVRAAYARGAAGEGR